MPCKPIDRNLKTASVAVLKSTEHDVTLTSSVADLSYPEISNFCIMCGIDARERECSKFGVDICICLGDIARKRGGAPRHRILLSSTVDCQNVYVRKAVFLEPGPAVRAVW